MRDTDIHSADLAYRRRSLLIIAAIVVLTSFALWQLDAWLTGIASQLAQDGDPQRTRRWLRGLLVALGLLPVAPLSLLARSLRRLAAAAQAEQRFPPRDWRTLRDVRVLRGAAALRWIGRVRRMAAVARVLAALCAAVAMAAFWYYR